MKPFAIARENFNPKKRAYAMQLHQADTYRIGSQWYSVNDKSRWQHGALVESVNQLHGRHIWTVDDEIEANDYQMQPLMQYQIDHIQMTNLKDLVSQDFEVLGYKNLEDMCTADMLFNTVRCWLLRVTPINIKDNPNASK